MVYLPESIAACRMNVTIIPICVICNASFPPRHSIPGQTPSTPITGPGSASRSRAGALPAQHLPTAEEQALRPASRHVRHERRRVLRSIHAAQPGGAHLLPGEWGVWLVGGSWW